MIIHWKRIKNRLPVYLSIHGKKRISKFSYNYSVESNPKPLMDSLAFGSDTTKELFLNFYFLNNLETKYSTDWLQNLIRLKFWWVLSNAAKFIQIGWFVLKTSLDKKILDKPTHPHTDPPIHTRTRTSIWQWPE